MTREEFIRLIQSESAPHKSPEARDHSAGPGPREGGPAGGAGPNPGHQPGQPPRGFGGGPEGPRGGFEPVGPGGPGFQGGGFGRGGFGPGGPGRPGFGPGRPGGPGRNFLPPAEALFERFDPEHKGALLKGNVPEGLWNRIAKADANSDGSISKEELEAFIKQEREKPAEKSNDVKQPDEKPAEKKEPDAKPEVKDPVTTLQNKDIPADALQALNV